MIRLFFENYECHNMSLVVLSDLDGFKAMSTTKGGKIATRGQKQIYEENCAVIRQYSIAALATSVSIHFEKLLLCSM